MTTDSVPAPMVQVPDALLEAVDRMIAVRQDEDPAPFYEAFHKVVAARAAVDAATPAASVPAADILALADHYETQDGIEYPNGSVPCPEVAYRLHALVDAADTPRDETIHHDHTVRCASHDSASDCDCAPAAPVGDFAHSQEAHDAAQALLAVVGGPVGAAPGPNDVRVPVNDEAEAAWQAFDEENILDPDGFAHTAFKAGFRAARGEDA